VEQALKQPWFQQMEEASQDKQETLSRLKELVQNLPLEQGSSSSRRSRQGRSTSTKLPPKRGEISSPQNLPLPHFANYVPRLGLQSTLRLRLLSNADFTACQGLPGMGKTQLATYLLHDADVQSHFGLKLWFQASDQPTQLETQYLALAQELGLADAKTTFAEAFSKILDFFSSYQKKHQKNPI